MPLETARGWRAKWRDHPGDPPGKAGFELFLPEVAAEHDISAHASLCRYLAWASALLADLALVRDEDVARIQERALVPIHVRRADAKAVATTGPVNAEVLVTG